jgi:hypothetical protein
MYSKNQSACSQRRLSSIEETKVCQWILIQEKAGRASTHENCRYIITQILKAQGDEEPLGEKFTTAFLRRNPAVKTNLGRRLDYKRINAACPGNVDASHKLLTEFNWIPARNKASANKYGIMRLRQ